MGIHFDRLSPELKAKIKDILGDNKNVGLRQQSRPRSRSQPVRGQMNKTEQKYAGTLALQKAAGEIVDFGFQRIKLRLADNTFYTPDFDVVTRDEIQLHEVKGFWEDDARVKIKVAAGLFWQFKWLAVRLEKGVWKYEEF